MANLLITVGIAVLVDLFIFKYISFYLGLLVCCGIIYHILKKIGIAFRSPSIFKGSFLDGVAFLKDYEGDFISDRKAFEEAKNIIKTFKLDKNEKVDDNYLVMGIYYDKPGEVENSKLRYSVGIYKKNKGFPDPPPKELGSYCNLHNYSFYEFPGANSLYSEWDYVNSFSLILGIKKFYEVIKAKLVDAQFKRSFGISEKDAKIIIELYQESKVLFYAPLFNVEKFKIHKQTK